MKIFFAVLGVVCFVIAATDVGFTVMNGLKDNYFYFGTVEQAWSRYFSSGMHTSLSGFENLIPGVTDQFMAWLGKRTAAIVFGILGVSIIILSRFNRRA